MATSPDSGLFNRRNDVSNMHVNFYNSIENLGGGGGGH